MYLRARPAARPKYGKFDRVRGQTSTPLIEGLEIMRFIIFLLTVRSRGRASAGKCARSSAIGANGVKLRSHHRPSATGRGPTETFRDNSRVLRNICMIWRCSRAWWLASLAGLLVVPPNSHSPALAPLDYARSPLWTPHSGLVSLNSGPARSDLIVPITCCFTPTRIA